MKKLILIAVLLTASVGYSLTSEFILNSVTSYSGTKTATATVDYTTPILIQTATSGVSMKINGAGTALPIVANTQYKFQPGGAVTSLVFSQTSSATPMVVNIVK